MKGRLAANRLFMILLFTVGVAVGAVYVASRTSKRSIDWRKVTIEGFGLGVTREIIESGLGPPERVRFQHFSWKNDRLRLDLRGNQWTLAGARIEYQGRVLACGSGWPDLKKILSSHKELYPQDPGSISHWSDIVRLLGDGEPVDRKGRDLFNDSVSQLSYKDKSGRELKVHCAPSTGKVLEFSLSWTPDMPFEATSPFATHSP